MIRKCSAAAAFALAALALTAGPPGARADLLTNGGFETYTPGSGGGTLNTTGAVNGDLDYSPVDGWTTTKSGTATIAKPLNLLFLETSIGTTTGAYFSPNIGGQGIWDLWGPAYGEANGLTNSPVGGNFLALEADPSFNGPLSQTVSGLTVGQQYDVGFWWARAQAVGFTGDTSAKLEVTFGGDTLSTGDRNILSKGFGAWEYQSFRFTAGSAAQDLSFLAVGGPGGLPPFVLLDGVSVTAVPEPSTMVLGSLGLFGVGAVRRWQRRRAGAAA